VPDCIDLRVALEVNEYLKISNSVGYFGEPFGKGRADLAVIFSEREREFTFAICYRPSVCLLSVCRL